MAALPTWPSFWPRRPTADDATSARADHSREVIAWWADANPIDLATVSAWLRGPGPPIGDPGPYVGWTPEDRDRLVRLADVMWVIGGETPEARDLAERVAMHVCAAEFAAGVAHLTRIAAAMTPDQRALALYLRSRPTGAIDERQLTEAVVENLGEAIARRFDVDPRMAGQWLSSAATERVAEAVHRIRAGLREVEAKLLAHGGRARGSGGGCLAVIVAGSALGLATLLRPRD